jgi:hypothetical protein
MEKMANRVKVIYTRVGDNLITYPSVEAASWLLYGTPVSPDSGSSASWFASGSRSMYVLSDAANEGVLPASAVAINAAQAYVLSVMVNVASGVWTLEARDEATSTQITSRSTAGC